jgi:transposase InsO family protein
MKADRGLTIARMVQLGGVSRASFYRCDEDGAARPDRDRDLRDAIQRIALEWPSYGRPRITAALRRQGWRVNPKRVHRLLREAGSPLGAAVPTEAEIPGNHRFQARPPGLSEPGWADDAHRHQPIDH